MLFLAIRATVFSLSMIVEALVIVQKAFMWWQSCEVLLRRRWPDDFERKRITTRFFHLHASAWTTNRLPRSLSPILFNICENAKNEKVMWLTSTFSCVSLGTLRETRGQRQHQSHPPPLAHQKGERSTSKTGSTCHGKAWECLSNFPICVDIDLKYKEATIRMYEEVDRLVVDVITDLFKIERKQIRCCLFEKDAPNCD